MMKKYLSIVMIFGLSISSCNSKYNKEIGEIESLLSIVKESENALLSIDTGLVFEAKRQMDNDVMEINASGDTLTREEAFKLDDVFGSKKRLHTIMSNYPEFIKQIEFAEKQLNNLKQDLENGLVKKEDFSSYYTTEQTSVMELNNQITRTLGGLELTMKKLKEDRPILIEILEKRRQTTANE